MEMKQVLIPVDDAALSLVVAVMVVGPLEQDREFGQPLLEQEE